MARWVDVPKDQIRVKPDWVVRNCDRKAERQQVLMLIDDCNVTNKYLKRVDITTTSAGGQAVEFSLNAKGGELLSRLTGDNLPQPNGDNRSLAIILDGAIITAAIIQSRIHDDGEITGNFSDAQIKLIADILRIRELPARLRLMRR